MIRGIGAQLVWSLKIDVRTMPSHLLRLLFVGLLLLSVLVAWTTSLVRGAPGLELFKSICYINVLLILLGGISYFATTVTEEKEADSLSLLKLAGMGPLSILLGKFASRLIGATMLLMVQFPFTLLAITLGGCTVLQVIAAYCALTAFLFLVATTALICSIRCSTSGTAAGMTAILVLLMFLLPSIISSSLTATGPATGWMEDVDNAGQKMEDLSVFKRLRVINSTGFAESPFSDQFKTHLGISLALFLFAWLIFEPSTRDLSGPERGSLVSKASPLRFMGVSRVWSFPFVWKDFYFITGGKTFFIVKFVMFGVVTFITFQAMGGWTGINAKDGGMAVFLTMLAILAVEGAIYSARVFFDEIRWNSLASITLTPRPTRSIAWGKVMGCGVGLIPAAFWMVVGIVFSPVETMLTVVHPTACFALIQYMTFLHVGALLSLHVRWGALPLALVITLVLNNCCPVLSLGFFLSSAIADENQFVAMTGSLIGFAVYWAVILFPIECEIASRLRKVAGK